MKFKTGQKLVCVNKGSWRYRTPVVKTYLWGFLTRTIVKATGPKFNEEVTCDGYFIHGYIYLKEYAKEDPLTKGRLNWDDMFFEPLVEDSVLEKELEIIKETV